MHKILAAMVLGIIIYGCLFSAKYPALEPTFSLVAAQTQLEPKESLGLLDGIHNGFAALGNTVASYLNYLWNETLLDTYRRLFVEETGFGFIRWLVLALIAFVVEFVFALLAFLLHLAFYVALLFKLFFVAASPFYHLGFLAAAGFTWLLLAAVARAAEEAEAESGAQE
jgi:hypothetical protein